MNDEVLWQLTDDRRREREREAQDERLAAEARRCHHRPVDGRASTAALGILLAARRHATH